MSHDPLPSFGNKHDSSFDALKLILTLIEMKGRVEREIGKRGRIVPVPDRINKLAVNVQNIGIRYQRRAFYHYESEEGYIKEFGEWLISTHAEVTGTRAGAWEHQGVPFNPAVHLRKQKKIFTG